MSDLLCNKTLMMVYIVLPVLCPLLYQVVRVWTTSVYCYLLSVLCDYSQSAWLSLFTYRCSRSVSLTTVIGADLARYVCVTVAMLSGCHC